MEQDLLQYIDSSLIILLAVIYGLGLFVKKLANINDWLILVLLLFADVSAWLSCTQELHCHFKVDHIAFQSYKKINNFIFQTRKKCHSVCKQALLEYIGDSSLS